MRLPANERARRETRKQLSRIETLEVGFDSSALRLAGAYDDLELARLAEEDVIESPSCRYVSHRL